MQRLRQGLRAPAGDARDRRQPQCRRAGRALWLADGDRGAGGRPRPEFRAGCWISTTSAAPWSVAAPSRATRSVPRCLPVLHSRHAHAAGMAATGKHFPGHGRAEADSHVAIPEDARSLEEIRRSDLVPVRPPGRTARRADAGPCHLSAGRPAARRLFPALVAGEILRGELKFDGVIFSDDLSMAGAHVVGDAASRIEGRPGRGLRHGPGVQRPGFRRAGPGCPATPEGDPAVASSATHAWQGLREVPTIASSRAGWKHCPRCAPRN